MASIQSGKEVKVTIPTSASELTVEQYQRFLKVEGDETFKLLKALEIFANIPLKVAHQMQVEDVFSISTDVLTLINTTYPLKRTLSFRGQLYGFIPNLEDITYGEYIDLDDYLSDFDQLHQAMGVLYRPVVTQHKHLYDIAPYVPNDGYKDFPLDVALGATLFFSTLRNKL